MITHPNQRAAQMKSGDQLKNIGLKATTPRKRILELFEHSSERHLCAEDVYRQLVSENFDVGLATVYRVLTQFEQAGLLLRHRFDGDKAYFELDAGEHHDHLLCLRCGRVEEFFDPQIEKRQKQVAAEHGFNLRDHSLTLFVDCERDPCPHRKD